METISLLRSNAVDVIFVTSKVEIQSLEIEEMPSSKDALGGPRWTRFGRGNMKTLP